MSPKKVNAEYKSIQPETPLLELTCYMGSHGVACHPAEVTCPPLPPVNAKESNAKEVFEEGAGHSLYAYSKAAEIDLATQEGCKAELS